MDTESRFLEAGDKAVRPSSKGLEALSQDEDHSFVTVDGESFPKNVADRDAETDGFELGGGDSSEAAGMAAPAVGSIPGDETMEGAPVKVRRAPKEPTEEERLKHEATHIPYRSWCQHCVRGRGRTKPHFRKREQDPENAVPKISMDYFFLGSEEVDAADSPMFVMVDEETGNKYARMVECKGLGEGGEGEWLLIDAAEEIRSWGHPDGEALILKCDNEASMRVVRDTLGRYLGGSITPENPPVGEKQANGVAEEAGKTVRDIMKVYKSQLEDHVGPLDEKSGIMQWMAR